MEDVRRLLEKAVEHHQAEELETAEVLYRRVLESDPDHWGTMYRLGTVLLQLGRFSECVEFLRRVVAARPDVPEAQNNLGVAYKAIGQWEPAARAFQAAVKANPEYEEAFYNLGALMEERGLHAVAEKCYRHARDLNPNDARTCYGLGNVLVAQQKWQEAEDRLREAARLDQKHLDVAVSLGFVLVKQERLDEAADAYTEVLHLKPDYYQVHNSLSYIYERQGKLKAAVESARRALEIQPDYAEGHNNLGNALRSLHRLEEACDCFRKAVRGHPDFALAEFNFGTTQLLRGHYLEGWPGYERHAETIDTPPREFRQPRWNGAPIAGRKLLVYADQGVGDTLQFVRFLKRVKDRSRAHILFECPAALQRLLTGQTGVDRLVVEGDALPAFDLQVPLANLPGLLGIELESIPADVPYVRTAVSLTPELEALIESGNRADLKVGLVWQGNPKQARDVVRSCRLETFVPLAGVNGVSFFSLQTGETGPPQMAALEAKLPIVDVGTRLHDFAETAAVISRLDLVITVDTAVAHLTGALGRPVWTLLCHTPDWRWLLERSDSPWYPTMRLFRQPQWGDWDAPVRDVASELNSLVARLG